MLIVGLTGGMGSGKSTVSALLAERGAVVIDADRTARQVVEPGGPAYQPLIDHFGAGIVLGDGSLDRAAIAARAFSDPGDLAALNAITHPAIAAEMARQVAAQVGTDHVVVLDIPLLTGASRASYGLAGVIVVDIPDDLAVRRLVEQRGLTEEDIRARMAAQVSRAERGQLADVIIDNRGSRDDLERRVDQVWVWIEDLARANGSARLGTLTSRYDPDLI